MTDKDAAIGRKVMVDELNTINSYEAMADHASPEVAEVVRDIADEEKVHVGEAGAIIAAHDKRAVPAMKEGVKEARKVMGELPSFDSMMKAKGVAIDDDGNVKLPTEDYAGKGYQGKGYADAKKHKQGTDKNIKARGTGYKDVRHRTATGRISRAKGKEGVKGTYEPIDYKDKGRIEGSDDHTEGVRSAKNKGNASARPFTTETMEGRKELKKSLDSFEDMLAVHGFEKAGKKKSAYARKRDSKLPTTRGETAKNRAGKKNFEKPVEGKATEMKLNQPGVDPKTGEYREERNAQRKGGKYKRIYGKNDNGDEIGGSDSTDRQWVINGVANGTLTGIYEGRKLVGYITPDGREFPLPPTSVEYSESLGRDRSPETNYMYGNRNSIYNWLASNGGLDRWNRDVAAERAKRAEAPENEQPMYDITPEEAVANSYLDTMDNLFAQQYAEKHPDKPTIDGTRHLSEYYGPQTIIDYFNKPQKSKAEIRNKAHREALKDQSLINQITTTPLEEKTGRNAAILDSDTYKNLYDKAYGESYDQAFEDVDPEEILRTYVESNPQFVATGRPYEELTEEELLPYRQDREYRRALTSAINDRAHELTHGKVYQDAVRAIEGHRNDVNKEASDLKNTKMQLAENAGVANAAIDQAAAEGSAANKDLLEPYKAAISGIQPGILNTYMLTPEQRATIQSAMERVTGGMSPEDIKTNFPTLGKFYGADGAFQSERFLPTNEKLDEILKEWDKTPRSQNPDPAKRKKEDSRALGMLLKNAGIMTSNTRGALSEIADKLTYGGADLKSARGMQSKADTMESLDPKTMRAKRIIDAVMATKGQNGKYASDPAAVIDDLKTKYQITTTPEEIQQLMTPAGKKRTDIQNESLKADQAAHEKAQQLSNTNTTGDGVVELTDEERGALHDSLGAPGGSMTNDVVPKVGSDYTAAWDAGGSAEGGGNPAMGPWIEAQNMKVDADLNGVVPKPTPAPKLVNRSSGNLDNEIKTYKQTHTFKESASFEDMLNARIQKTDDGRGVPSRGKLELIRDPWRMTHLSVNDPVNVNANDGKHTTNGEGISVKTMPKNDGVSGAVDEDNRPSQKGTGVDYIAKSFEDMLAERNGDSFEKIAVTVPDPAAAVQYQQAKDAYKAALGETGQGEPIEWSPETMDKYNWFKPYEVDHSAEDVLIDAARDRESEGDNQHPHEYGVMAAGEMLYDPERNPATSKKY